MHVHSPSSAHRRAGTVEDGGTHGEGEAPPSGGSRPVRPDTVAGEQDAAQHALLAAVCKGGWGQRSQRYQEAKGSAAGNGAFPPHPAGALTLVIEEAMAREDEPAALPEPEPRAVLGREMGGKPE